MKRAFFLLIPAVAAAGLWFGFLAHRFPTGKPPAAAMDLAAFRVDFNRAADRPRLILLLSPT